MSVEAGRRFYFGTNFKMHHTPADSHQFLQHLLAALPADLPAQLFLIPPFTSLNGLPELAAPRGIWIGAQNMHWEMQGPYTGEISPAMLQALQVNLVLLGHAERRCHYAESDRDLGKKLRSAVRTGLRPLLCLGESAEEREAGAGVETVVRQLRIALDGLEPRGAPELLVAYEPVWSIGEQGRPATPGDVAPVVRSIRAVLCELFPANGSAVPILYGGSVNPGNCEEYAVMPETDGLFVGRAAWNAAGFVQVLSLALQARKRRIHGV